MSLEDQLHAALRRQDPSAGFAGRVVARVQRKAPPPRFRRFWIPAALAAAFALALLSTAQYQHMQQERAGRQAVQALRIAAEKLNLARNKVLKHTENQ